MAVDLETDRNPYHCPASPDPEVVVLSSCTASPPTKSGYAAARAAFDRLSASADPDTFRVFQTRLEAGVKACILEHYGAVGIAECVLLPSGTDAVALAVLRTCDVMIPDRGSFAVAVSGPEETGSGVPAAVAVRPPDSGCRVVTVSMRHPSGCRMTHAEVDQAFCKAVFSCRQPGVIVVTHSGKTGLIGPLDLPFGASCVVDACQGRITQAEVAAHLRGGRAVAVTGSKFIGGPAFCGAVLFPLRVFSPMGSDAPSLALGPLLRWVAATDLMRSFAAVQDPGVVLAARGGDVRRAMAACRPVVLVDEPAPARPGWPGLTTIFPFHVLRPDGAGVLSMEKLRELHRRLSLAGVLFGQPVPIGRKPALRLALGALDAVRDDGGASVRRAFDVLESELPRL